MSRTASGPVTSHLETNLEMEFSGEHSLLQFIK